MRYLYPGKLRDNGRVIVSTLIVLFILAAATAVYVGVFYTRHNDVSGWVAESVDAWRSDSLDTDGFEIHYENGRVGDIFESFLRIRRPT